VSAVISPCGQYRYRLDRAVGMEGPVYAFFGINPSTADANLDDATVRKWIGFMKRWGGSRFIVGNVFAFRATDVKVLSSTYMPQGRQNDEYIDIMAAEADILVPCWGSRGKVPIDLRHELDALKRKLIATRKPVMCFGFTATNDPMHPLMLGYDTPLVPFA